MVQATAVARKVVEPKVAVAPGPTMAAAILVAGRETLPPILLAEAVLAAGGPIPLAEAMLAAMLVAEPLRPLTLALLVVRMLFWALVATSSTSCGQEG